MITYEKNRLAEPYVRALLKAATNTHYGHFEFGSRDVIEFAQAWLAQNEKASRPLLLLLFFAFLSLGVHVGVIVNWLIQLL